MSTKHPGSISTQTLQQRLSQAEPRAGITLLIFWKNLFELNPALRPILPGNAAEQDRFLARLLHAEVAVIAGRQPAPVASPAPTQGSMPNSVVGEALLWTLQEAFGADFTPEVCSAWETLYRFVTGPSRPTGAANASSRSLRADLAAA